MDSQSSPDTYNASRMTRSAVDFHARRVQDPGSRSRARRGTEPPLIHVGLDVTNHQFPLVQKSELTIPKFSTHRKLLSLYRLGQDSNSTVSPYVLEFDKIVHKFSTTKKLSASHQHLSSFQAFFQASGVGSSATGLASGLTLCEAEGVPKTSIGPR